MVTGQWLITNRKIMLLHHVNNSVNLHGFAGGVNVLLGPIRVKLMKPGWVVA